MGRVGETGSERSSPGAGGVSKKKNPEPKSGALRVG